jgi:hypothetical protein
MKALILCTVALIVTMAVCTKVLVDKLDDIHFESKRHTSYLSEISQDISVDTRRR